MKEKFNIAIIGATGNVGLKVLEILNERNFPVNNIYAVASQSSLGKEIKFGENKTLKSQMIDELDFKNIDIAFFAAGSDISEKYAKKIASQGCIVIDKSSYFRMHNTVPLIVPEVNPEAISKHNNIICSPNCSVIPLVIALKPFHEEARIKRIIVSTYQSVSGAGIRAMKELARQSQEKFFDDEPTSSVFPKRIAFNIIPQIDEFMDSGATKEEGKIVEETQKILGKHINITVTCVRVPVMIGHSSSVNVEFEKNIAVNRAQELLELTKGVVISSAPGSYTTPLDAAGMDEVFISRLRKDLTVYSGLNLWIVSDNLRKGAALNAVQIAELLIGR